MTKRTRRKFTNEQKDKAVEIYLSGEKTAAEIAKDLDCDVQNIYTWKTVAEEKRKGLRLEELIDDCLLYTSPSPRDKRQSRMPSSA